MGYRGVCCLQVIHFLLAENERMQRIVDEFERVYKRGNSKVNVGKSKVMVFETARAFFLYSPSYPMLKIG